MNQHQDQVLQKFLFTFCLAFIVSVIGLIVGQFVPPILMIPLMIVELILIIIVVFARKSKKFGYSIMYLFMFISGITLYVSISHYVSELGADVVLKAFIVTVFAFIAIAIFGYVTKFNFGFLGNFLFFALLILLIAMIVGIFIPFGNTLNLIISIVGIAIFAGFTLYDFNKIAREGIHEEDIPITVINIYLDFINLFLYVLRFLQFSSKDD